MRLFIPCLFIFLVFFIPEASSRSLKKVNGTGKKNADKPPTCSMTGTYTIGSGGNFTTISTALDSLKARGIAGDIILELKSNYTSTAEVFPITFPQKSQIPCLTGTNYRVTLQPSISATSLQITGTLNDGLVFLDSTCNYVTIDGRPGGQGTVSQLSISNNRATAVKLLNASNNIVRYVKLSSWGQVFPFISSAGVISFVGFQNPIGSANNKIEACELLSDNPGNVGSDLIITYGPNFNDSIVNCSFHDFTSAAINIASETFQWKVIGNSFYNIVGSGSTSSSDIIKLAQNYDAVGHLIQGNYFGGTAPHCAGNVLNINLNYLVEALGKVTITNNYFRRLKIIAPGDFYFIRLGDNGNQGNQGSIINSNQFGGALLSDSVGIFMNSPSSVPQSLIQVIYISPSSSSGSASYNEFNNIRCNANDITKAANLRLIAGATAARNNIIGNPSIYNSIINNTCGETIGIKDGIVTDNIISNITNTSAYSNVGSGMDGIIQGIVSSADTISNNQVFRLTATTSHSNIASVIGIWGGSYACNVIQNNIHSLINNGTGGNVMGIYSSTTLNADKNNIHSLVISNPLNSNPSIYGIYNSNAFSSGTFSTTVSNNMIRLGLDTAGNSITIPTWIYGIAGGSDIFHNSVAIMGSNVADGFRFSFNYNSTSNPNGLNANVKNNIFYNSRSNLNASNTSRHYLIQIKPGDQSNYNLFFSNGTGAYIGTNNNIAYTTFAQWKTGTGKDLNSVYGDPLFINPTGGYTNGDLHLTNGTIAEAAGTASSTVAQDIDNFDRTILTPVDIGADAGNFNQCAFANAGNNTSICPGSSIQIGTPAIPNHTYSWTSSPAGFTSSSANPTVSPTVKTTYFLTLSNLSGTCNTTDSIVIDINPAVTPAITISTTTPTICNGTAVTFTASITNGGVSPMFQWKVNGVNTGASSPTFTNNSLNNGDQVSCILTSNAGCVTTTTANSNVISITVSANVIPTAAITADATTVCAGTSVTFTAAATNGGTNPIYQWQVNGVNAGTNNNTFTTATLTNNAQVKVILTSSLSCALPVTATSNIITTTITPLPVANAGRDTIICAGSSVQLNGSGGVTYLWTALCRFKQRCYCQPYRHPSCYISLCFNSI